MLGKNVEKMTNWKPQKDEKNVANHPSLESFYREILFTESRFYPKIGNTIYLEGYVEKMKNYESDKSIDWLKNAKSSRNKFGRKSVKSVKGEEGGRQKKILKSWEAAAHWRKVETRHALEKKVESWEERYQPRYRKQEKRKLIKKHDSHLEHDDDYEDLAGRGLWAFQ